MVDYSHSLLFACADAHIIVKYYESAIKKNKFKASVFTKAPILCILMQCMCVCILMLTVMCTCVCVCVCVCVHVEFIWTSTEAPFISDIDFCNACTCIK